MVYIGTPQKRMENVLRLIHTQDSEGNPIAILTNRFDLEADEIGQIYRERWAIETFFKWMKQHVRIKSFYGPSEQAVMNPGLDCPYRFLSVSSGEDGNRDQE